MTSNSKGDISKALARNLTGIEAARLILQDSVEVDHGRPGFLSDKDIQRIKGNLSYSEMEVYNAWMWAYRAIDYTLKEAHISCQNIIIRIYRVLPMIGEYYEDYRMMILRRMLPTIVTQKQYEDLKAAQREYKLRSLSSLYSVIDDRIRERYPEAWDEWENSEEASSASYWIESNPEAWREALEDVIGLVEADKLRPVLLKPKDLEKLAELEQRLEEVSDIWRASVAPMIDGTGDEGEEAEPRHKEMEALEKERDRLKRRMYDRGLASWSKEQAGRILGILRKAQAGPLSEELEAALDNAYCSGQDLYNTGLPEQIETIEAFWPGYNEVIDGENDGADLSGYAIIQDPHPDRLDKRGYYKDDLLQRYSRVKQIEEAYTVDGRSFRDDLRVIHKSIKSMLRDILATQSTLETVSKVIAVDFTEDMAGWIGEALAAVEAYNKLLQQSKTFGPYSLSKDIKLPALKVNDLKPSTQYLKYLEERMAMSLGQNWAYVWAEERDKLTMSSLEEDGLEIVKETSTGFIVREKDTEGEEAESDN